jgi:hypothetical protein
MHRMSSSDWSLYIALNSGIAFRRCMRSNCIVGRTPAYPDGKAARKRWSFELRQHELRYHVIPSNYAYAKYP